ncbi:MAG: UDP-2,3-diacylglucosamine diphosphatase [Gammaproteobacteria bacterium]|nr:UDP-2,3-diacylglucosamine diphosphatase [Gammaproteobacteria bacterium]
MTTLFVSDLHLDASRPAATDCFLHLLEGLARDAGTLYILGDLFEAWSGDDVAGAHERAILLALKRYTTAGSRCFFLRGNRDFLVGSRFLLATGVTLLDDESLTTIDGNRILLMHGDTLCTDDHAYQRYRRVVHNPVMQSLYLALPAPLRSRITALARWRSTRVNAGKPAEIMDVNPAAVADALRRHRVQRMIHGHTHRPAIHSVDLDGQPASRIVLGAWYEQGSVLRWGTTGPELQTLAFT